MSEIPLEALVLGPTRLTYGERVVDVDRPLERALLVRLALARGAAVPDQRLAADLWGDGEVIPPTQRLRVLASRLRTALGDHAGLVSRTRAGYRLAATPADLLAAEADASRLHAAVRSADHTGVLDAAAKALAHWRGPALADLRAIPYARAEGERLDNWRLELTVQRLRAELELGAAVDIIAELGSLAAEHPLHEPIGCLHAHALYRAGQQADALAAISRLRRALADELGVDPTAETAEFELRLLRQDPALLPPARHTVSAVPEPTRTTTSLPGSSSSFVGRDGELVGLLRQLADPGVVTLVGVAGSGKSRLAVELARATTGRSTFFVELAPLRRDDAVVAAVAETAGVEDAPGDPFPAIAAALDGSLLVLDNAEHLVEQVSTVVAALRRHAAKLTVLVTSQRPLRLGEEIQHQLGPLSATAAAELFTERAAPGSVTAGAAADIAAICQAVDGLPLGVELAAGLTRTLTVSQLAARMTDRLRLLVGGSRDAGPRHTSLRAALDWGHELLDERTQAVLRRVGVFAGSFDLEAAEQVASGGDVHTGDVAPALTDLVDRNLTMVVAGQHRFALLETVRAYAVARLGSAGELDSTRSRHMAWCLAHVEGLAKVDDFRSAEIVDALFAEWPNLLEALEHAPGTDRATDGMRLVAALDRPWAARGWFAEGRRHFAALAGAPGVGPAERVQALSNHAFHAMKFGQPDEAAELLAVAAELAATVEGDEDDPITLMVSYYQGVVDMERGRLRESIATLRAGLEQARGLGLDRRVSSYSNALGNSLVDVGEVESALEYYRAAAAGYQDRGDENGLCVSLHNMAEALLELGQVADALRELAESDHYAHRLDDQQMLPLNHLVRAAAARQAGRLDEAEQHLRTALTYPDFRPGEAHIDLADVLIARGELDEAEHLLESVYADRPEGGFTWQAARPVSAALALARGDADTARRIVDQTKLDYASSGFGRGRYTAILDRVAAAL